MRGGHALEVTETDLTTHRSGYMIASAANGFMHTNPFSCDGTPYNFQPEYSAATPDAYLPWGFGPYDINTEYEIGHFEPCTSLSGSAVYRAPGFRDRYALRCHGPYETGRDTGKVYEPNDAPCYAFGDTHGGAAAPDQVTGCLVEFYSIGDLDYDGTSYWPDWPDSVTANRFPAATLQIQPTGGGAAYPELQFVTDNSATQFIDNCNVVTGAHCVLPPPGPGHFYPYWTEAAVGGHCVWEFGNLPNGRTFGRDAQYGSVGPDTLGAFAGRVRPNPAC
jgi:hypothetical protein